MDNVLPLSISKPKLVPKVYREGWTILITNIYGKDSGRYFAWEEEDWGKYTGNGTETAARYGISYVY